MKIFKPYRVRQIVSHSKKKIAKNIYFIFEIIKLFSYRSSLQVRNFKLPKYISTFDLIQACHQIPMVPKAKIKLLLFD